MPLKLKKATANTSKTTSSKGKPIAEEQEQEDVAELQVTEAHAMVGVDMSFTKNLGDYNSARVSVSISVPSEPADIEETFEFAKQWAEEKLSEMVAELPDEV
jgi:hypothetical protein